MGLQMCRKQADIILRLLFVSLKYCGNWGILLMTGKGNCHGHPQEGQEGTTYTNIQPPGEPHLSPKEDYGTNLPEGNLFNHLISSLTT